MAGSQKSGKAEERPLLFICQDSVTLRRENLRAIVSHARKTQATQKHNRKRVSAKRDATYARSLVGWQQDCIGRSKERMPQAVTYSNLCQNSGFHKSRTGQVAKLHVPEISPSLGMRAVGLGGLRTDPFSSFPLSNSDEVMRMVDFYVHVYSIHKSGVIDDVIGPDTKMDICWPYVLKDEMLFAATVAISRVALLMSLKEPCKNDPITLKYLGKALALLKERAESWETLVSETVIFTVARLVTIAYMTSDDAAFSVHLAAFDRLCEGYLSVKAENDEEARIIDDRIKGYRRGWQKLLAYRTGQDPLQHRRSQDKRSFSASPRASPTPEQQALVSEVALCNPRFYNLVQLGAVAIDILSIVASLAGIFSTLDQTHRSSVVDAAVGPVYTQLYNLILSTTELSDFETQLCYSLIAMCVAFCSHYGAREDARCLTTPTESPGEVLDAMAEAFIYKRYAGATSSPLHHACLQSMALGLGCACFLPLYGAGSGLRLNGHIILFSLKNNLLASQKHQTDHAFATMLRQCQDPFWNLAALADHARQAYTSTTKRQSDWEKRGIFNLGIPGDDKVEYLVLRSFRGALPSIPEPIFQADSESSSPDAPTL